MRVSLSQLCKTVGHDRLAARRFLERRGVLPDKEGRVGIDDAKVLLEHVAERTNDADTRVKAKETLKKISGPYSEDWAKALNLSEENPLIEDVLEDEQPIKETQLDEIKMEKK